MKELPRQLKYVFLEPKKEKPVIILVALTELEEHKMLEILKKYKEEIAWSIEDLKGISPSICMHKSESSNEISCHKRSTEMAKCRFYICNLIQPLGEPSSSGSHEGWIHCGKK